MAIVPAAELGIELLLDLAQKGDIDPWDVDVVEATDRCLETLDATDRNDLRLCGRALHCATVLLRLKSTIMAAELSEILTPVVSDDDWESFEEVSDESPQAGRPAPYLLDLALARRSGLKQPRRRRVTLAELISELRRVDFENAQDSGLTPNAIRKASHAAVRAKTVGLAHDEDVEGDAKRLANHLQDRFNQGATISFALLVVELRGVLDEQRLFLALTFLAHWGVLELCQTSIYDDISVRPSPDQVEGGAIGAQEAAA